MRARVVVLLLSGLALSGCGTGTLGHEEFIARGDQICRQANAAIRALGRPLTVQELIAQGNQALAVRRASLARFVALKPPKGVSADVRALAANFRRQIAITRSSIAAARAGNSSGFVAGLRASARTQRRSFALGRRIGFQVCGTGAG